MSALQLAGGLVLLLAGGEALVKGGVAVAQRFGVSPMLRSRGRLNGIRISQTMVEGRRVITSTRSERNTASRMLWVMKIPVLW